MLLEWTSSGEGYVIRIHRAPDTTNNKRMRLSSPRYFAYLGCQQGTKVELGSKE